MALARVQYTADGATDVYSIPFPYIDRGDVKVSLDGVETSTFVFLDGSTVKFDTPPGNGVLVDIKRETERQTLLVEFNDGSTLLESDLTLAAQQSFYIAQESFDQTGSTLAVADDGSYSASQRRISLLGYPTEPQDAANKQYVDDVFTQGRDAYEERLKAEAARNAAEDSEEAAATSESNALSYRNSASSHRQAAEESASAAAASESAAAASAAAAKASEDDVAANASAAASSEASALSYKNSAESYKNTAVSSANSANASAVNASNSEAKAALWAEAPEDSAVDPGKYSAKHHAKKASASSASAAASATSAMEYRDSAYSHRSAASASATEASGHASDAASSATTAASEADRAHSEADRAMGYAGSINLPGTDGHPGGRLRVKSDESGFEFAPVEWGEVTGKPSSFTPASHNHDDRYLRKNASGTIDAGTNTTLTLLSDDSGSSTLNLYGNSQGTGRLYVGQSASHGGGIEYNGDNSPGTTGAGADYIVLWRRSSNSDAWTARNKYDSNNWEFRGNVTAYASDGRLKENVEVIEGAIEKVEALRGVQYDWKDECEDLGFIPVSKREHGVIAQEVEEVVPDAVAPAPFNNDYLTVRYERLVPLLIQAVKELSARVKKLEEENGATFQR